LQVISPSWLKAKELREAGYGWEDLFVMIPDLTEAEARLIVLGREAYMRWAAGRKKAS
jgi:hypothetical protein